MEIDFFFLAFEINRHESLTGRLGYFLNLEKKKIVLDVNRQYWNGKKKNIVENTHEVRGTRRRRTKAQFKEQDLENDNSTKRDGTQKMLHLTKNPGSCNSFR